MSGPNGQGPIVEWQPQGQQGQQSLQQFDAGKHYHNDTASAQTGYQLPLSRVGMTFEFTDVGLVGVYVQPAAGEYIHYGTSVAPAGGRIVTCTGGSVRMVCLKQGHWHVVAAIGTITS